MTVFSRTFQRVLLAAVTLCGLAGVSPVAQAAKCTPVPQSINMHCEGKDCDAGIFWKSKENKSGYQPHINWTSDTPNDQFEVIVVDDTGNQVPWPYPLGQGLYLSMTGDFAVTVDGHQNDFPINDPAHQFGYGPLASFATKPGTKFDFHFTANKNSYRLYVMSLGGEDFEGQIVPRVPRLWLTVRGAGSNYGKSTFGSSSNKSGLVCGSGSISLVSPCSIQVDPTTITFDNMRSSGARGLAQVRKSNVAIKCDSGKQHKVYMRVFPAKGDKHNKEWARFKHKNGGDDFQGLALIHKLNQRPANCDDGDIWGEDRELGKTSKSGMEGSIYWGLCRTDSRTDVGEYSTSAVIYFWVD